MTGYILRRHGKYLNRRLQWTAVPCVIEPLQYSSILSIVGGWRDQPEAVAEVHSGSVDLDAIVWTPWNASDAR